MSILGYNYALCLGARIKPGRYSILYHGTDRHPHNSVRTAGLPRKGTDLELLRHAEPPYEAQSNSAFRGTTQFLLSALRDAGAALWGQFIYEVSDYPGYDIEALLNGRIPCPGGFRGVLMQGEQEIAIPAEVPLPNVTKAGRVKANSRGQPVVEWEVSWP